MADAGALSDVRRGGVGGGSFPFVGTDVDRELKEGGAAATIHRFDLPGVAADHVTIDAS